MVLLVGSDKGSDATVLHPEGPHIHAFTANSYAAIAKNAAWAVEEHHSRPLLFPFVRLCPPLLGLGGPVGERHVLQFARATRVAHRAFQRMISHKNFDGRCQSLM